MCYFIYHLPSFSQYLDSSTASTLRLQLVSPVSTSSISYWYFTRVSKKERHFQSFLLIRWCLATRWKKRWLSYVSIRRINCKPCSSKKICKHSHLEAPIRKSILNNNFYNKNQRMCKFMVFLIVYNRRGIIMFQITINSI